jgi:catechol 2,3-dioxygenase-like lactoylglutathione lyase family enzyme
MSSEIEFDHVAMPVGDIERAVEFYQRVLGARASRRW